MRPNEQDLVVAEGVSHHFGAGETLSQILFDITIHIPPGQLVIMTGPSGSGKTTLLTLMGALRSGQKGVLRVLNNDVIGLDDLGLTELRRNVGFIFQLHNLIESLNAIDNVLMSTHLHRGQSGEGYKRGVALLERLGLGHRIHHKPAALSGGQRQRVAVARALINSPRLILADEPTAALDRESSLEVVSLLQEHIAGSGSSCLMVTHDNRVIDKADRLISMVDGRIVSDIMVHEQVRICEMLSQIDFFSRMGSDQLSHVAEKMQIRKFHQGDVLIREGDVGEEFYLLGDGQVDVHRSDAGDAVVATLGVGHYFGERALITGEKRNATIVCKEPGMAYALDKASFKAALASVPSLKDQLKRNYFARH
ncbi:MAG: ATP-binding cassette domain-containing protein [Rhodospirillaceae bacterium]